jgi:predicted GNAT family N-acyltransferase
MFSGDVNLVVLKKETIIKSFNCDDSDLKDFLESKAKDFHIELLAKTYILEDQEQTLAYFSVFNDSVRIEDIEENLSKTGLRKLLSNLVTHRKRHLKHFPATKIGRLAVCDGKKEKGLGRHIMKFIINLVIEQNEVSACKFIAVDAYANSLGYYEKMGFVYLSNKDEDEDTRQMYLDVSPYINQVEEEDAI